MKFCPECGAKLENQNAKFCSECGYKLVSNTVPAPAEESKGVTVQAEAAKPEPVSIPESVSIPEPVATLEPEVTEEPKVTCVEELVGDDNIAEANNANGADNKVLAGEESDEETAPLFEIADEYTKQDFIRKAWIKIAEEQAPIEIFESDFSDVKVVEHQILSEYISVDVDYSASIGNDREEPYLDYETYYEDEPYLTTETYYDYNVQAKRTRQVTKYKKVARQRQVTKYKTVTDWSPFSSSSSTTSVIITENLPNVFLAVNAFEEESAIAGDKNKNIGTAKISRSARNSASEKHMSNIVSHVYRVLPGDHSKDVDYNVSKVTDMGSILYNAHEYRAVIKCGENSYEKSAFPFGEMLVSCDSIENPQSPQVMKEQKLAKTKEENEKDNNGIVDAVWSRAKWLHFATLALLLLSSVFSCFLRYPAPLIILFVFAISAFVATRVITSIQSKKIKENVSARIAKRDSEAKDYIENYLENYEKNIRELLDKKLKSLGCAPLKDGEFSLTGKTLSGGDNE